MSRTPPLPSLHRGNKNVFCYFFIIYRIGRKRGKRHKEEFFVPPPFPSSNKPCCTLGRQGRKMFKEENGGGRTPINNNCNGFLQRTHSTQGADRTNRSKKEEEEEEEGKIRRRELPLRWTEEEEEARQNTACLTSPYSTSSFSICSPFLLLQSGTLSISLVAQERKK